MITSDAVPRREVGNLFERRKAKERNKQHGGGGKKILALYLQKGDGVNLTEAV